MLIPVPFLFAEKGAERMEEEVNQRVVSLSVNTSKMTAGVLVNTMKNFLVREHQALNRHAAERKNAKELHHGKTTIEKLMAENAGADSIPISDNNIRLFDRVARKYNIDYAIKEDATKEPHQFMIFFKVRDRAVMDQAFNEFIQKNERENEKKSVKEAIREKKAKSKELNRKKAKERHKHQDRSL